MAEQPVDLSVLDPRRNEARFDAAVSRIAQRAIELRRLRRAVVRRGITALAIAMAAGLVLWFAAPKRNAVAPRSPDLLDWATRDVGANDVLGLGGSHAQ
jgi:hypothetical protein